MSSRVAWIQRDGEGGIAASGEIIHEAALLDDLITRLEAATEGSRELDAAIYLMVTKEKTAEEQIDAFRREFGREPGESFKACMRDSEAWAIDHPMPYTTSLDAALAGERICYVLLMGDGRWEAEALDVNGEYHMAEATTEPLARRIAALRARKASDQQPTAG